MQSSASLIRSNNIPREFFWIHSNRGAFCYLFEFFIIGSHFLFHSVRDSSRAILIFDEIVLVELKENIC